MGKVRKIDFSGVPKEIKKGGGGGVKIPEGDYPGKILEGEFHTSEEKGSSGIKWVFQITKGKYKGKKLRGYTSLKPEALWSLRNLIHAATGKNVAGKALNLDIDKLVGKAVGLAVQDNEYKKDGKTKITSEVNTCFPLADLEETEEEEEDDDEVDDDEVEEDDDEETEEDDEDDDDLEDVEVDEL